MKIIVFGATGGTGRQVVRELEERGHTVTSFVRDAARSPSALCYVGDARNSDDVARAVRGHDAAVVTLGITENPLMVRLKGASGTSTKIRSVGTANVLEALEGAGIDRVIVQTTYGVGPSKQLLSLKWRFIFSAFLGPQITDTEVQEELVRSSGLDWTLIQPVSLTDEEPEEVHVSRDNEIAGWEVPRAGVARVIADSVAANDTIRATLAVSA